MLSESCVGQSLAHFQYRAFGVVGRDVYRGSVAAQAIHSYEEAFVELGVSHRALGGCLLVQHERKYDGYGHRLFCFYRSSRGQWGQRSGLVSLGRRGMVGMFIGGGQFVVLIRIDSFFRHIGYVEHLPLFESDDSWIGGFKSCHCQSVFNGDGIECFLLFHHISAHFLSGCGCRGLCLFLYRRLGGGSVAVGACGSL